MKQILILAIVLLAGLNARENKPYKLEIYEDFYFLGTKTFLGKEYKITQDSVKLYQNDSTYFPVGIDNVKSLKVEQGNFAVEAFCASAVLFYLPLRADYREENSVDEALPLHILMTGIGTLIGYGIKKYDSITVKLFDEEKELSYFFYPSYNLIANSYELGLQIKF